MTAQRVLNVVSVALSLAALLARGVALCLADLDSGLRDFRVDTSVVPEWMNEEADLP